MGAQTLKKGGAQKGGALNGGGAKISRFMFPLPPHFFSFLLSLWGPFVEFRGVFEGRSPQMYASGVLGSSATAPPKPPGLHTDSPRAQTCTFERPDLQKHHQNSTRRPPRERRKNENCGGRGEKSGKFWALHPSPPLRAPTLSGLGPHPSGPNPTGPHPSNPHPSNPNFLGPWGNTHKKT